MKPRRQARTTTSVSRMRALHALGDPRVTAALLDNPELPKKLRRQIARSAQPTKASAKGAEPSPVAAPSTLKPRAEAVHTSPLEVAAEPSSEQGEVNGTKPKVCSFQPIAPATTGSNSKSALLSEVGNEPLVQPAPLVIDRRTSAPSAPTSAQEGQGKASAVADMATVTSIAPALALSAPTAVGAAPTLQDSLNRVLTAFKKDAAAAGRQLGPGTPGEIVNTFLWVSCDASSPGGDKPQYTSDWIILTELRACFGRKSRSLRRGEYCVYSRSQVSTIDADVASLTDAKDPSQKPCTFVTLRFNLDDGTSLVRHIFVGHTDLQSSPALTRIRERLVRMKNLGWPLAEGRSWDAIPAPEPASLIDELALEAH